MKRHTSEGVAQIWAMKVLWRLLDYPDQNQRNKTLRKIQRGGFISLALKLLRQPSTSRELFEMVVELVCALLDSQRDDVDVFESVSESVPSLLRRVDESLEDMMITASCCNFLSVLTVGIQHSCIQEVFCDAKTTEAIVDSMDRLLGEYPDAIRTGCWALWQLSAENGVDLTVEFVKKALKVMSGFLDVYGEDGDLIASILGFATNTAKLVGVDDGYFPSSGFRLGLQCGGNAVETAVKAFNAFSSLNPTALSISIDELEITRLLSILREGESNSRQEVCSFLGMMATKSSAAQDTLLENGILPTAVSLLVDEGTMEWKVSLLNLVSVMERT